MTSARGRLAPLLLLLSVWTAAADFDGSRLAAPLPPVLLAPPRPSSPSRPLPAAASAALSFNGVELPRAAFTSERSVPELLIAAIGAARVSLDLALYDLNLPGVAAAVVGAKERGVRVRLIYDRSHGEGRALLEGLAQLDGAAPEKDPEEEAGELELLAEGSAGPSEELESLRRAGVELRLLRGGSSYGIMHNKIALLDGRVLKTGSFNWTRAAERSHFENVMFRDAPGLVELYGRYWEWMWGLAASGAQPGAPPADPSPSVRFRGKAYPRASFSPNGGTEALLLRAIADSRESIEVAMFSFYSAPIADALIAAKANGVRVRVAADASQARRAAPLRKLADAGVELRLSKGREGRGVMHHKYLVFDRRLLASGSYNLSQNAERHSYENELFSADADDLGAFHGEFERVWAQARPVQPGELPEPR